MLGVDKSIEVIDDLAVLAIEGIAIAKDIKKDGWGYVNLLSNLGHMGKCVKAIQELVADAPAVLPELKDLDAAECARLGAAGYALVSKVIDEIRA
jgi:hypothetical protein